VLFLPENEIHEIGLLFVNYELLLRGYKTIYLGQTMPLESLTDLQKYYNNLHFLSYFTVIPTKDGLQQYIKDFNDILSPEGASKLWILGRQTQYLAQNKLPDHIRSFESVEHLSAAL
jgi:hypothetical protein